MSDLICKKHNIHLMCMGGRSAHEDNWYCPVCDEIKDLQEQLEMLEKGNKQIYEDAKFIRADNEQLKARNEKLERVVDKCADFLTDISTYGYVNCTSNPDSAGCYLIDANEFDKERAVINQLKDTNVESQHNSIGEDDE